MVGIKDGNTIGIILCTYNGRKFIREQLDSIVHQTDQNWHLIISDDASTDDTINIVREYEKNHPDRIEIIERKESTGNAGIHFLTNIYKQSGNYSYMMCADQDDVWRYDKIEIMRKLMNKAEHTYSTDMPILVHTDSKVVDENLNLIAPSFMRYQKISPAASTLNHLLIQNTVTGASMMMNKSLTGLLHNVPQHAIMHDSWMALLASCFGVILYSDRQLYKYRQHENSVLGALGAGIIPEVSKKLSDIRQGQNGNYIPLYLQAEELYKGYADNMTDHRKEILEAFINMRHMGRVEKIRTLLHYGFTYSSIYRTLGECAYI